MGRNNGNYGNNGKYGKAGAVFLWILCIAAITIFLACSINLLSLQGIAGNHRTGVFTMEPYLAGSESVEIREIRHGSLKGYHVVPERKCTEKVMFTFGDAGGVDDFHKAMELGQRGYEVVAVSGSDKTRSPVLMSRKPLAFFRELVSYARENGIALRLLTMMDCSVGEKLLLGVAVFFIH